MITNVEAYCTHTNCHRFTPVGEVARATSRHKREKKSKTKWAVRRKQYRLEGMADHRGVASTEQDVQRPR